MTAASVAANRTSARARTGGPSDDDNLMEHIAGWALVVVVAMLATQLGLFF
ncbi:MULTISPECIES: SCO1431 family membrane protein [Streptomyces]|uniref:SCO1431 family membrane protein n=1 Tax=Streptomyces lycii TaxID=2654337 RepID=A0ABQ7FL53_9ACTN|nr:MULTISPECIES: SCO1431 family membrane protein [Streptomyces]KAF4409691.1 SCO1431 family membrane protein [Streptomyces lycii]